ncbi:hypothetical protein BDQ17DRAFT_1413663 [Cyathus striatus]|nr:hypothetical protein BDQ17DRAFT_1413663 [Cyathus striatus]
MESLEPLTRLPRPQRILVIGGGPAGLVTLCNRMPPTSPPPPPNAPRDTRLPPRVCGAVHSFWEDQARRLYEFKSCLLPFLLKINVKRRYNNKQGEEREEHWDAVVVAVRWYDNPVWPSTLGLDILREKGVAKHAKEWRGTKGYEGKKILIIRNEDSSNDIAAHLAPVAHVPIYQSQQREPWFLFKSLPDAHIRKVFLVVRYEYTLSGHVSACLEDGSVRGGELYVEQRLVFGQEPLKKMEERRKRAGRNPSSLVVFSILGEDEDEYVRALRREVVSVDRGLDGVLPSWSEGMVKDRVGMYELKEGALWWAKKREEGMWTVTTIYKPILSYPPSLDLTSPHLPFSPSLKHSRQSLEFPIEIFSSPDRRGGIIFHINPSRGIQYFDSLSVVPYAIYQRGQYLNHSTGGSMLPWVGYHEARSSIHMGMCEQWTTSEAGARESLPGSYNFKRWFARGLQKHYLATGKERMAG